MTSENVWCMAYWVAVRRGPWAGPPRRERREGRGGSRRSDPDDAAPRPLQIHRWPRRVSSPLHRTETRTNPPIHPATRPPWGHWRVQGKRGGRTLGGKGAGRVRGRGRVAPATAIATAGDGAEEGRRGRGPGSPWSRDRRCDHRNEIIKECLTI